MQLINNMVNMKNVFIGNTFAKVFLTKWESSVLLFPVSARAYLIFFERRLKCIEGTSGNLQSCLRTRHKTLTSSIFRQPLNLWAVSNFLNTAIQYSLCQLLLVSTICWKTFVRETSGGILSLPIPDNTQMLVVEYSVKSVKMKEIGFQKYVCILKP